MESVETGQNGTLSPRQQSFIVSLLSAPTISHALEASSVPKRTAYTWLADPAFQTVYRQAKRDALNHATGRLAVLADAAVATLAAILVDGTAPAAVRLAAARTVLEMGVKGAEVEDTQARLDALEAAVGAPRLLHAG